MTTQTIERIIGKLETLSASNIVDVESIIDGYASKSVLPKETLQALEDIENGNVTQCDSPEELFEKLGI